MAVAVGEAGASVVEPVRSRGYIARTLNDKGRALPRDPLSFGRYSQATTAADRRRAARPVIAKPTSISAQLAGSGTAVPNTRSSLRP